MVQITPAVAASPAVHQPHRNWKNSLAAQRKSFGARKSPVPSQPPKSASGKKQTSEQHSPSETNLNSEEQALRSSRRFPRYSDSVLKQ